MWSHNVGPSERRSRRRAGAGAAARASFHAGCLVLFALTLRADGAAGGPALREKDVRRAEKIAAKLRLLDGAAAAPGGAAAFRDLSAKLYPGLFMAVAEMHRSDLKTDLDTAVFLYAEVRRTWLTSGASAADCGRQRPDIYLPLCLELRGGTVRQLLLSKARLHARWAEAVVKNYRGAGDAETAGDLSAMRAARGHDLVIAARVVEALKSLEGLVNAVPAYGGTRGRGAAHRVSFDDLDGEIGAALGTAGALLYSLPRGPAFYCLSNAWRSFKDGQFWYRKVHQSKRLVVSVNGFERDPLTVLGLDADQVSGTAIANWDAAIRYTRQAEQRLSVGAR